MEWITKTYLESILRRSFEDEELVLQHFEITPGAEENTNFASRIYRIRNQIIRQGEVEPLDLIAKHVVSEDTETVEMAKRKSFSAYDLEKFTLQCLLPTVLEKINSETLFYPKLYYAEDEENLMILEDLCKTEYEPISSSLYPTGIDLNHALLVVEVLAKFHAGAYLAVKENPELKNKYRVSIFTPTFEFLWGKLTRNSEKYIMSIIDELDIPERFKAKLKNLRNWEDRMYEVWKQDEKYFNSIIHCDVWMGNFMFKYVDDTVRNMKLIDFQTASYNSVALDLVSLIYNNCSSEVQVNGVDTVLEHYYENFVGITGDLPQFNLNVLKQDFKEKLFFGLQRILMTVPLTMFPGARDLDVKGMIKGDLSAWKKEIFQNPVYLQRLINILPYFEENNVF